MGLDDHLMSTRKFAAIMNEIVLWSSKNYEECGYDLEMDFRTDTCVIS